MRRRLACLAVVLTLLLPALPARAASLAFVAVNDTIPLTLPEGSLPFHSGGDLYVPYTVFNLQQLGIFPSYRSGDRSISLFGRDKRLTFDLEANTVADESGTVQNAPCLTSGGILFLPAVLSARHFGLQLSELTSRSGYTVIRFTNGSQVYDDSLFIEKAEILISNRVSQYLSPAGPEPSVTPVTPVQPAAPEPAHEPGNAASNEPDGEPEEETPDPATVYLAVLGLSGADEALDALSARGQSAVFFLTAGEISANGALVRRIAASGCPIGLCVPEGANPGPALRAANDALDRVLHEKSVLALLPQGIDPGKTEEAYRVFYAPAQPLTAAGAVEAYGETRLLLCQGRETSASLSILERAVLLPLRETTSLPKPELPEES